MRLALGLFLLLFLVNVTKQDDCLFNGCTCEDFSGEVNNNNDNPRGTIMCDEQEDFPKRDDEWKWKSFESLDITNSPMLTEIPDDRFDGLSIESLHINENHIYKLGKNAFKGLSRVKELDLSDNCIGCSEDDKKESAGNTDDTSHEQLQNTILVDETVFDPLKDHLENLDLNTNRLRRLSLSSLTRLFEKLHHLKSLNLAENGLKSAPNLHGLHRLETLNMKGNKVVTLNAPKDSSSQLILPSKLKSLNLEHNMLGVIEAHWFSHLTMLRDLNLRKNAISAIAENAFANLKNLENLDLSKNYIKHVPTRCFFTLGLLKSLDLSEQTADFVAITDYAFDRELRKNEQGEYNSLSVKLKKNKINNITNKAFCATRNSLKSTNINSLDLSENPLSEVNPCVLRQLNSKDDASVAQQAVKARNTVLLPKLNCNCDVTYLSNLFNLEDTTCKKYDSNAYVKMGNFYCDTDYEGYSKNKMMECKKEEFDCARGKPSSEPDEPTKVEPENTDRKNASGVYDHGKDKILTTIKPKAVSFAYRPSMNSHLLFLFSLLVLLLIK